MTAEMNIIEIVESTIADIKNKIEKQEEMTNPQRFVYVVWRRKFKGRTRCIYYDIEAKLFIIGRADSFISKHSLDNESKYKKVALVIELKNHLSTVVGIWFDSLEKKVYSISEDKRFLASEIGELH